jgi:hypothetical protein
VLMLGPTARETNHSHSENEATGKGANSAATQFLTVPGHCKSVQCAESICIKQGERGESLK